MPFSLSVSSTPFSSFLLHPSLSLCLSLFFFPPVSLSSPSLFSPEISLVDWTSPLSKWQHGIFQTWAGERKSERGMERIETPFIRFFLYILSLFLHNDDLSPLDFLFLTLCVSVCVCTRAHVCGARLLCVYYVCFWGHYVTYSHYRLLVKVKWNSSRTHTHTHKYGHARTHIHTRAHTYTNTYATFIRSSRRKLFQTKPYCSHTPKVLILDPAVNKTGVVSSSEFWNA